MRILLATSVGIALVLAGGTLVLLGAGENGTLMALRITARWCFLLFWLAYAARPLATLFGPAFDALARRSRQLGLAFAASLLVHLCLVVWVYYVSKRSPIGAKTVILFGIGVVCVALLTLLSFGPVSRLFNPRSTRIIRNISLNYIAFVFIIDFAKNPLHGDIATFIGYAPFLALAVAGAGLWITATYAPLRIAAFFHRAR